MLPGFTETMRKIKTLVPGIRFVLPAANQYRLDGIQAYLQENCKGWFSDGELLLTKGNAREAMIASDTILLASGTATLEAMLCKRPMVTCYKLAPLTYKIMQRLYKAPFFALPNLLAGEALIPELLQDDVNPDTLCEHLVPMFSKDNSALIQRFTALHKSLKLDADKMAAQAIAEVINE